MDPIVAWFTNFFVTNEVYEELGISFEDRLHAYIDFLATKISDLFFGFLESMAGSFSALGSRAIEFFSFSFTNNFFVTVIGLIFGFFICKFIIGKVIDLLSRVIDFT